MDNFEVVGTAVNDFYLKLKESLLILKNEPMFKYRTRVDVVIPF